MNTNDYNIKLTDMLNKTNTENYAMTTPILSETIVLLKQLLKAKQLVKL